MQSNAQVLWAVSLGLLSHWTYFLHGEHHMLAPVYGCLFVALLPIFYILEVHIYRVTFLAIKAELEVITAYLTSLFTSMIIYRVFFHRLRKFSGPFGARVSKLWHVWKVRHSQNHLVMEKLHHGYGTFVRTGPEEITIFHPEALVAMNGPGSSCTRSDWYDGLHPLQSLPNIRSPAVHDHRRRIWDKAFSATAVRDYDCRIIKYAEQLNLMIAESVNKSINVYAKFSYFTSDVMSDLSFGKSFGQLVEDKFHHSVLGVREFMGVFGTTSPIPWFGRLGNKPMMQLNGWKTLMSFTKASLRKRMMNEPPVPDIASYLLSASAGRLEEDAMYLDGDALILNIVGSDQTATSLITLFAQLARHPKYQEQIFEEVQKISSVTDFLAVLRLPILKSVIMETLRLWPPLPTGIGRIVPDGGLTIAGKYIPGGTTIFAPRYSIARMESCFEKATEFIPERWTTRPEMVIDKRAYNPFSSGRYSCVGQRLAMRQVSHVTALLVSKYTVEFGPDDDGTRCFRDMKDSLTMNPGRLDLVFRLRKAE